MDDRVLLLRAIADETRLTIISELRKHARCVRSLAFRLGISSSAISQHLKILREQGLVTGMKSGYYTHYCLDPLGWQKMRDAVADLPTEEEARLSIESVRECRDPEES
ncbi:MAG: metalloregulator ArsR/SmtB family transcription factor [Bacillota bacterium]